jgi:hypothetical protein
MADLIYDTFKEYLGDGTIDMDGDSFKICLLDDGHTPDATDSGYADVSADELASGNGYTTGGETLTTVVWDRTGGTVKFDADNAQWTSATFTARYAVIYDDTVTTPTADPLVCLIDFGANKQVSSGTFTIEFNSSGIITLATGS